MANDVQIAMAEADVDQLKSEVDRLTGLVADLRTQLEASRRAQVRQFLAEIEKAHRDAENSTLHFGPCVRGGGGNPNANP